MPTFLPAIFAPLDEDGALSSPQRLRYTNIIPLPPVRPPPPQPYTNEQDNPIGFPLHDETQATAFIFDWFSKCSSWQRQVFLCGLTKQCSRNILEQLISSLEPVLHRDFTVSHRGRYPVTPFTRINKSTSKNLLTKDTSVWLSHKKKQPGVKGVSSRFKKETSDSNLSSSSRSVKSKSFDRPRESVQDIALLSTGQSDMLHTGDGKPARLNWSKLKSVLVWGSGLLLHASDIVKREELICALANPTAGFLPYRGQTNNKSLHHHQSSLSSSRWSTYYPEDSRIDHSDDDLSKSGQRVKSLHFTDNLNPPSKQKISKRKKFKQSLNVIWEWLDRKVDSSQLELFIHLMKQCDLSDISFLTNCLINRSNDRYGVYCLPDNILLYIFSYLTPTDLTVTAQVCKKWRHLSDLSDIWMLKCNELGFRYGLTDINSLITNHSNSVESVDWKTAYKELYNILQSAQNATDKITVDSSQNVSHCDTDDTLSNFTAQTTITSSGCPPSRCPSSLVSDDFGLKSIDRKLRRKRKISLGTRTLVSASIHTEELILFQAQHTHHHHHQEEEDTAAMCSPPLHRIPLLVQPTSVNSLTDDDETGTAVNTVINPASNSDRLILPNISPSLHTTIVSLPLDNHHPGTDVEMSDVTSSDHMTSSSSSSCSSYHSSSPPLSTSELIDSPLPVPVPVPSILSPAPPQRGRRPDSEETHQYASMDVRLALEPATDIILKSESQYALRWKKPHENTSNLEGYETIVKSIYRVRRLKGHMDAVLSVWSDHKRIVSGSVDRTIRVCDSRSGCSLRKMYGHMGRVTAVFFNKSLIVSGSWDMTVMAWHPVRFTQLAVMTGHRGSISSVQADNMYIVSGAHDKTVRVWSVDTFQCVTVITGHTDAVTQVVFKNKQVISSSWDRTLRLSSVPDGKCLRVFEGHSQPITSVQWCGSLLLSGSLDGCVYFWNEESGECEAAIQAHDESVLALDYFKTRFFTASSDSVVKEWDVLSMTCIRTLHGHKGPVRDIRVSDDMLVTCSDDGDIRVWDLADPQLIPAYDGEYIHTVDVDAIK